MAAQKIPRAAQCLLSVREVLNAAAGDHFDGGGLTLNVRGNSATWVLRYTSPNGKRREMGLGSMLRPDAATAGKSLTSARAAATEARLLIARGIDPIDERDAADEARRALAAAAKAATKKQATTLARAARDYHERMIEPQRSEKHGAQWIASLENHIAPALWKSPIDKIEASQLLDLLSELHASLPETAKRVRQRLEAVFDDALLRKLVLTNPASVLRRPMKELGRKSKVQAFRSMPPDALPEFWTSLAVQPGTAVSALALLILTASRTADVLYATWDEFDVDGGVWLIPGKGMKADEDHVVHLNAAAIAVVERQRRDSNADAKWVFPSPMLVDSPMSNMAMLAVLDRMQVREQTVVHGFRSTFSTWANESGRYRPDVIEVCLAHSEADRVRGAYNRAKFTSERIDLMRDWGSFVTGVAALQIKAQAA